MPDTQRIKPIFFAAPAQWREWLAAHHDRKPEVWVGFHKKTTGRPSLTWPEAVDQALCFGWIDGVRRSIDAGRYVIRFTPRRRGSTWSAVNARRARALIRAKLMHPRGLAAFRARDAENSAVYAYQQRQTARLPEAMAQKLRANRPAWAFFQAQPAWYQRVASYWVVSAKKAETRQKRLATLIEDSARSRPIKPLARKPT